MELASLKSGFLKSAISGAVLLSFVVGFLCIGFISVLPAHAAMDMGSMPNHSEYTTTLNNCCNTSASDHMELWKSTFVGIPQSLNELMTLMAVAIFTVAAFTFSNFFSTPRLDINFLFNRFRQYARAHPDIRTYNVLRLAFARGILHPKTF